MTVSSVENSARAFGNPFINSRIDKIIFDCVKLLKVSEFIFLIFFYTKFQNNVPTTVDFLHKL